MLNDTELQARIDRFLHRKEEQFPELAPQSDTNRRSDSGSFTSLRLSARSSS